MKNNKLLFVVLGLTIVMVGINFGSKFLIDKVADRVIEKLLKEYSPSPYGPGLNPDKIDAQRLTNPQNQNFNSWNPAIINR